MFKSNLLAIRVAAVLAIFLATVLATVATRAAHAQADEGSSLDADLSRLAPAEQDRARAVLDELASALPVFRQRIGGERIGRQRIGRERLSPEPVRVVFERDYADQARRINVLGPAVVHDGRLHVVLDPDDVRADLHLQRQGLARLLLRRAGLALPPGIEDGASLWVASVGVASAEDPGTMASEAEAPAAERQRLWYGRPWRLWLPDLAASRVLPSADDLLAGEREPFGSDVLWSPVAAAFVDSLRGDDLASKLRRADGELLDTTSARRAIEATLGRLESAVASGSSPPHRPTVFPSVFPALFPALQPTIESESPSPRGFHRGVSFAMANGLETGYHAPVVEQQLERLCRLGSNAVSLMPFAYQPDPNAPSLRFLNRHPASETDTGLIHAARRADAQGFVVLWKPHLWIGHHSWPGDVEMTSDADWQRWFRAYRLYLVHHAVLAADAGAEWLSIGVELGRTLEREAQWRELIESVRRVYPGRVTYAGNWHAGYERAPFWDALDAVGIDAYFPLADRADASRSEIEAGARRAVEQLAAAAERWQKPILLTEIGFAAHEGPWVSPHEEGGPLSLEDQRLAWEIFLDALGRPPWLAGLYVWKIFTHPATEESRRPDFQVMGRPAEGEIAAYFRRLDTPPPVLATPR